MDVISTPIIKFSGRHRKRALSIDLPDATAWLNNLQIDLQTAVNGTKVLYEIHAKFVPRCQDDPIVWTVSHSFDAFRRFRKQLLQKLQPGHNCPAECKWLYSVVKNHFPKPKLFSSNALSITEERRQSLLRILRILQESLTNRSNQGCNVLVGDVCYDFAAFICSKNCNVHDISFVTMLSSQLSSVESTRLSLVSDCNDDRRSTSKSNVPCRCGSCQVQGKARPVRTNRCVRVSA
ncbi:Phox homologous domain [Plasmopara halstedii]|uniref:Phox homologous domain n=1 Tax=Plasmopara halstedii TaxID=4781 RepID=A0A0P1AZW6_PLAHL|nr:Phox homologous domain [Plasmopara halstedii]CEG47637.1 Phox homologous domain [Plasmopara halstedii]|eukprot:XP_024584006.1 Phox homologous domain [Plasmopara halstedii]